MRGGGVPNFYHDYTRMVSYAKYKSILREVLKILTPKEIFQRLPIALPQVKAEYISENLLNEIREIIWSLYQKKEMTKKVRNKIMNSIKI